MTIIGGFLSALNIVSEKEKGTIEQINVTPVPKTLFLLSKLIPFWVIGFILLTIGAIVAWIIYGLLPVGNMRIIYLFDCFYRFGVGNIFYIVQPATGDVHGFLLLDYICFVERTFYPDQQYAAMGTDYNII